MNDFIPEKFRSKYPERKATLINRVLLNIAHSIYFLARELPFAIQERISPRPFRYEIPAWVDNAIFYQIYPQSFKDSNGDGIGDIHGIIEKLDYLKSLKIDCIWLNPLFESPFQDAGYDISDFFNVAERYGTNDDLKLLFQEAKKRDIRVVLDLVAGHSSVECEWFQDSANNNTTPENDKYIWTKRKYFREPFFFVKSKFKREGYYRKNYYECQPALNYGYGQPFFFNRFEQRTQDTAPLHTRETLKEIIAHWMNLGASGFRVDMAESLVKRDAGYKETIRLWNNIRDWMQKEWPESILISEWSFPEASIKSGFQIDFVLPMMFRGLPQMIFNETGTYAVGNCYFDKEGKGNAQLFIQHFITQYKKTKGKGVICLPTANHDYQRPHCGNRNTWDELKAIMLFNLTWSDLPMIYYGDEIGMRYLEGLINKEGSAMNRYINRAGERTPMQWERSETAGFSSANPEDFYLPIDDFKREDFPNLAEQQNEENSLLNFVKSIIEIRKKHQAFSRSGELNIVHGYDFRQYPLAYTRRFENEVFLIVINPSDKKQSFNVTMNHIAIKDYQFESLINKGISIDESLKLRCEGVAYALFKLTKK